MLLDMLYLFGIFPAVYGHYEYWMFLKSYNGFGWRVGYMRRNIKTGDTEEVKVV
jgi:hypothetical protein